MINILILNWNSSASISRLLESISLSSYKSYRVILVDNNSNSKDKKNLNKIYQLYLKTLDIHLIVNSHNAGYAKGNNIGYQYILSHNFKGDLLILNPDILVSKNTLTSVYRISLTR